MWESEELKNAPTEKEKKEQKLKRKYSSKQLLLFTMNYIENI